MWVDAWFDVLASCGHHHIATATNSAVFIEIPLGSVCLYVALRTVLAVCLVRSPGLDQDHT